MKQVKVFNTLFNKIYPLKKEEKKSNKSSIMNALQSKTEKQYKNQSNKFIFYMFAFDLKEIHTLFMKFY